MSAAMTARSAWTETHPPRSSVARKFARALVLHCPRCGGSGILRGWLALQEQCPTCGMALQRGEHSDFWIGAYVFNLALGEFVGLGIPVAWMILSAPNQPWTRIELLALVLCIALPFVFFPFSRTLWLAWDLSFRPVEPGDVGGNTDVNAPPHPDSE